MAKSKSRKKGRRTKKSIDKSRMFVFFGVMFCLVLLALDFPIGELYSQEKQLASVNAQLAQVSKENHQLKSQISELNNPNEIRYLARKELGYVRPGETEYAIISTPSPNSMKVSERKESNTDSANQSLWQRVLHRLEFWN
jgi:cell division protein FtsB